MGLAIKLKLAPLIADTPKEGTHLFMSKDKEFGWNGNYVCYRYTFRNTV